MHNPELIICKYSITYWIFLFNSCFQKDGYGCLEQWCWPFEGSMAQQPYFVAQGFSIIKTEAQKQINKKIEQQQRNKKNGR